MTNLPIARARKIVAEGHDIGPRLHPCSCGAPKHKHAGKNQSGACPDTGCLRYRRDAGDALAERAMNAAGSKVLDDIVAWHAAAYPRPTPDPGGWGIGPSDVSRCRRAIWYRECPPDDLVLVPVDRTAMTLGSIFHDITGRARKWRYPWRRYEFEVQVPGLNRPGRVDEDDRILAETTDFKSMGPFSWEDLGANGPRDSFWDQLDVYDYAIACAGEEVETQRVLCINRETGDDEQFVRRFDLDRAKQVVDRLVAIALALDMGQEMPRDGRGPTGDPVCGNCEFRRHCWNMDAAEAAGRSPESYTILGEHPDAEAIEWAAEQSIGWKDRKREATKEYKVAIPLLTGVPNGKYGPYVVKERSRLMPDHKTFYETIRDELEHYELENPDTRGDFFDRLKRIPLPMRRDTWTEVRRVRAAELEQEVPA